MVRHRAPNSAIEGSNPSRPAMKGVDMKCYQDI